MAFENPYYFAFRTLQNPDIQTAFNNPFLNAAQDNKIQQQPLTGGRIMEGDITGDSIVKNAMSPSTKANLYGQAISGGLQLAATAGSIANQSLGLGKAPSPIYTQGVAPSYQLGDYAGRVLGAKPEGAGIGEILGTAGQAAATGASIGTMIGGPYGTLIGAGIGALAGGLTAGVAGGARKRKQRREKMQAVQSLEKKQQEYNTLAQEYNQQEAARSEYERRANPYRRMQNLFV